MSSSNCKFSFKTSKYDNFLSKIKKITENIIYIYTLIKNFESISYIVKIVAIETVFFSLRSEIFPGMNSSGGKNDLHKVSIPGTSPWRQTIRDQ